MAKQPSKSSPQEVDLDLQHPTNDKDASKNTNTPPSFREVINELNSMNSQMRSAHEKLLFQFKKSNTKPQKNSGLWASLKEKIKNIQWDEEDLIEKIQEVESIEIDEKERKKVVKRRKPLRERIRQAQPLLLGTKEDEERIATCKLQNIDKSDPILNIAERILLNLSTDDRSEETLSIQKAKEQCIVPKDTTPFSYPDIPNNDAEAPYYISNYAIIALYQTLKQTPLRDALPVNGNFIETEEMIIASQLEKHIKVHYNKNSHHIEIKEECLESAKDSFAELIKKRCNSKKPNAHSITTFSKWSRWFKH